MKIIKTFALLVVFLIMLSLLGCESTLYVIEEEEVVVNDSVETRTDSNAVVENTSNTDKTQTADNTVSDNSSNDNSSEIKDDRKKESKFSDRQMIGIEYAIQIGAFSNESNAQKLLNVAKSNLDADIYCKNIGGLYKVRVGNFKSKEEAISLIEKIKNGYTDSFVVELTYFRGEK